MAHVITQNCCKDASCVAVCPVDCIRPDPTGELTGPPMLYIDPEACIDCGACVDACPVDAIYPADELPPDQQSFRDLNAAYFARHPLEVVYPIPAPAHPSVESGALRVAIVGTGPAALYAASDLLRVDGVEVNLFERLPTPLGLIRAGVAPDHQRTKSVADSFAHVFSDARVGSYFNVEIGRDLAPAELNAHHHAVVYAIGASRSRDLGIRGAELPGSHAASDFVAWYNGHPDHAADHYDLSTERAIVIGNGNVALDVARVLLMPHDDLHRTDAAEHALKALSQSQIREVIVLGRRGARHAAFSAAELTALSHLQGVDVRVEAADLAAAKGDDVDTTAKLAVLTELSARAARPSHKQIVLRFDTTPVDVCGNGRVEGLRVETHERSGGLIDAGLILRSIGYLGNPIAGLPFDDAAGLVPNDRGRVLAGSYVTGWIKRGASGVIGTNRQCAIETVSRIWEDFDAGRLNRDVPDAAALDVLLDDRNVRRVDGESWHAIDEVERSHGAEQNRPRVKFVTVADMLATAHR